MASREIVQKWTRDAADKIEAHLPSVSEKLGVELDPLSEYKTNPIDLHHRQCFALQRFADFLEKIDLKLSEKS